MDTPIFDPARARLAAAKKQLQRDGLWKLPNMADPKTDKEVYKIFEDKVAPLTTGTD